MYDSSRALTISGRKIAFLRSSMAKFLLNICKYRERGLSKVEFSKIVLVLECVKLYLLSFFILARDKYGTPYMTKVVQNHMV